MLRLPAFRQYLIYTGAIVLIVLAVGFSLLRAILPYASDYRAELEQQISAQLGLPLKIASLDAGMSWFTPRLVLVDPVVYQADGKTELIRFDEVELTLAWFDSLRYRAPMLGEIDLVGSELNIERSQQGGWRIQGVELSDSDEPLPEALLAMLANANYSLLNSRLKLRDASGEFGALDLQGVNITVENALGEHKIQVEVASMAPYAKTLNLIVRSRGSLQDFVERVDQVYLHVTAADLAAWHKAFDFGLPYHIHGVHDIRLWFELDNKHLHTAVVQYSGKQFAISSHTEPALTWQTDRLSADLFWRHGKDNWQVVVRDFQWQRGAHKNLSPVNLIIGRRNQTITLSADHLPLQDVSQLAQVLLTSSDLEWKNLPQRLGASGELYNLFVSMPMDDWRQARVQFLGHELAADLSSLLPQQPLRFDGLDAEMDFQGGLARIVVHSDGMQLMLKKLFRNALQIDKLAAVFDLQMEEDHWLLRSHHIIASNADIDTQSRLLLYSTEQDGIFVDMQTDYRNGDGGAAHKYYPVSIMDPELLDWLDQAITDGTVTQGSFLLYGDVMQFPFERNGVMQAQFDVRDMNLLYRHGWPKLHDVQGRVLFNNTAMYIGGIRARSYRGRVMSASAVIDDLYRPLLRIDGKIRAPAGDLKTFIVNSPLQDILGEAVQPLHLSGDTALKLAIELPLDDSAPLQLDGTLSLMNNTLHYPEMQYELKALHGELRFTESSVSASNVRAQFDGRDMRIDIAPLQQTEDTLRFTFRGNWQIDSLLKSLDWIPSSWLDGHADWQVWLDVPVDDSNQPLFVQAESSLQGVSIAVSDQLSKAAEQVWPVSLQIEINKHNLDLALMLPDDNVIKAQRDARDNWLVQAETRWLQGDAEFHQSLSPDTVLRAQFGHVELSKLARSTGSSQGYGLKAAQLPSLDITTGTLLWRKWKFKRARVKTTPHRLGMVIDKLELHGDDLVIRGQGSWLASWTHPNETTLKLSVNSSNFGNALAGLGYQRIVDKATQSAELDLKWPDAPYRFSWQQLAGYASFNMLDGEVTEVDPGAGGRVLGLLNVFHLPRRLFLSFGDVYKDGFVFDEISGTFTFADGNAETRDTEINAAAAEVRIQGRVGMQAEDYDLNVRVKPKTSAATFTGGAIAGGPVVGAGLVLLQKILGLDKAAQDIYRITGSWDNPVIEQIEKAETTTEDDELDLGDDIDE